MVMGLVVILHDNGYDLETRARANFIAFVLENWSNAGVHLDNLLLDLWDQVSAYVSKTICEPVKSP